METKTITIMLLMTLWVSCQGPQLKPRISCDVSFTKNRCRCRCYDLEKLETTKPERCNIDSESNAWNLAIEECEGISGLYLDDIAVHVKPKLKEKIQYYKDTCN
ncbi:hypothetical protein KAR91_40855 [Candidatus Pacearchaeota archaeon]|nr:hypothetical protein [Candidatus Pacearchaeota archaeon]